MGLCVCGCPDIAHHTSMTRDGMAWYGECLRYGSNETGGMKRTWTGWWFERVQPYLPVNGNAIPSMRAWRDRRMRHRDLMRAYVLRRPWYRDHCHAFRPDSQSMAAYIVDRYGP